MGAMQRSFITFLIMVSVPIILLGIVLLLNLNIWVVTGCYVLGMFVGIIITEIQS